MQIFLHKASITDMLGDMHMHAAMFVYVLTAETAHEVVRLVHQHNSNTFVFNRKQFSEITTVREHKPV